MRGNRKLTLISLSVAIVTAAILTAAFWPSPPKLPPQSFTLPNGVVYTYTGVTYGTNHLHGSLPARLVHRLPTPVANAARGILGARLTTLQGFRITAQPSLCVWFDINSTNTPSGPASSLPSTRVVAKIADADGVESGVQATVMFPGAAFNSVGDFPLLPRRSRMLQLHLYEADEYGSGKPETEIGIVKFPNPVYGKFSQWKPDTGPLVRKADDFEVRLSNFFISVLEPNPSFRPNPLMQGDPYRKPIPGENTRTVFDIEFKSPNGYYNTPWLLHGASLSDATGNVISNSPALVFGGGTSFDPVFSGTTIRKFLNGSLWPEEGAWKLRLEFKRTPGINMPDRVVFKQVPVPKPGTTNRPNLHVRTGDIELVLTEFGRIVVNTNRSGSNPATGRYNLIPSESSIRIEARRPSSGFAVDFSGVTVDDGSQPPVIIHQWAGTSIISLTAISTNARTVDITLAVQKTRTVEFLLKPPM